MNPDELAPHVLAPLAPPLPCSKLPQVSVLSPDELMYIDPHTYAKEAEQRVEQDMLEIDSNSAIEEAACKVYLTNRHESYMVAKQANQ